MKTVLTSSLCMQLGFSSKFLVDLKLPELTSAQFSRLTEGFLWVGKWLSCGCSTARTSGGEQTGFSSLSPLPLCVSSNELLPWLGRVHCCYPFCVFVTLTKKTFLLIVSHGSRALSIHSLSCPSYWSSSSPNFSPIIPIRQVSSLIAWLQSGILMPPPQTPGSSEIRRGLDLGAWEVGWKCGGAQGSWLS